MKKVKLLEVPRGQLLNICHKASVCGNCPLYIKEKDFCVANLIDSKITFSDLEKEVWINE